MSVQIEGWFAPLTQADEFDDFFKERTKDMYIGYREETESLCKVVLFGRVFHGCEYTCNEGNSCSQRTSNFCQRESLHKTKEKYKDPNWYIVWSNMMRRLTRRQNAIRKIVGDHRFESFRELLTHNAKQRYDKYTRRECKEKNIREPEVFDSMFIGLEEIAEDPWQQYIGNKIKQGDFGCSQQFSGLDFLAL
jgi:hypothetical protein